MRYRNGRPDAGLGVDILGTFAKGTVAGAASLVKEIKLPTVNLPSIPAPVKTVAGGIFDAFKSELNKPTSPSGQQLPPAQGQPSTGQKLASFAASPLGVFIFGSIATGFLSAALRGKRKRGRA